MVIDPWPDNIDILMKRKELTKTFVMISIRKFGLFAYIKYIGALWVNAGPALSTVDQH